jgi:hypothetical protein
MPLVKLLKALLQMRHQFVMKATLLEVIIPILEHDYAPVLEGGRGTR